MRNIFKSAAPHRVATTEEFETCRVLTVPIVALLSMTWLAVACTAVHAGAYPERTVRVVVPFPAGGPTDVAARVIAQSLSSRLGQNVVVENVVGAAGRIGARAVASAHPDGYTLLLGGTNINAYPSG